MVEFVTEHGNTIRFTVPDTVAFAIIDALKASRGVKTVTCRALDRTAPPPKAAALVRLKAEGLSVRQIARALQASPSTIERRLRSHANAPRKV